jgi:pyruvate formate lyase activating enzyme
MVLDYSSNKPNNISMFPAVLFERLDDNKVKCNLCNHHCIIPPGKRGICGVRENQGGHLFSLVYGKIIAENVDPIEKKPLYHFLPGSLSYSIATVGCNFQCSFCQNYEISQYPRLFEGEIPGKRRSPEDIVHVAKITGCKSISYTYTEPTIFFEFALDTAKLAASQGLKNVFVSNGYMTKEAVDLIKSYLHGINVDLKSFRESFYKKICKAKLSPVLESLKYLKQCGIWVEITTLIIPGENDDPSELREMARFIKNELGAETPWHLSRFFPRFRMLDKPITPLETLQKAYYIGKEEGLYYIYIGNVPGNETEHTYCPKCQGLVIKREGFFIVENKLDADGACPFCGYRLEGVWR